MDGFKEIELRGKEEKGGKKKHQIYVLDLVFLV